MKAISEILTPDQVILDLKVDDKFQVISQLIKTLEDCPEVVDRDKFARDIVKREEDFPTGLENGTALPHARTTAVTDLIMAFGRCKRGVDFGAPDGKPSFLVFLFGVPRDEIKDYLKTIARLSRMMKQDTFRRKLMSAGSAEEIVNSIQESEKKLDKREQPL
jgi:PTS system fructose-specific IIC component